MLSKFVIYYCKVPIGYIKIQEL